MSNALNEAELLDSRHKLSAGRIIALQQRPYFAKILLAMTPHERIGLGTFAVDQRWRMYYDPAKCLLWTVDEIAAVWIHEAEHIMRNHASRFQELDGMNHDASTFNKAADAAINSDLRDTGVILPNPELRYYAEPTTENPTWRKGMSAEEMYFISHGNGILKTTPQGTTDEDYKEQDTEETDTEASDSPSSSQDSEDQTANEEESDDTDSDTDDENTNSEDDNKGSDEKSDASSDSSESDSSGLPSDTEEPDSNPSEDAASGSQEDINNDSENDSSGSDPGDKGPTSGKNATDGHKPDCGSMVDGEKRDYEETDDNDGSVEEATGEYFKRETAEAIIEYDKSNPGKVPGSLIRDAKNTLDPQIDWQEEFAALIRNISATLSGYTDYSYQRPSRRSSGQQFILPSMRQPPAPEIAIVLDTSGSMKESKELALGLAEMEEIISRTARFSQSTAVRIINCDAASNAAVVVKDLKDFVITGGGGTDMRVGIKAAAELTPRADVIITVTDGYTPWPIEKPIENSIATYIVLLVGQDEIEENDTSKKKAPWAQSFSTPEWMHVITVNIPEKRKWIPTGNV